MLIKLIKSSFTNKQKNKNKSLEVRVGERTKLKKKWSKPNQNIHKQRKLPCETEGPPNKAGTDSHERVERQHFTLIFPTSCRK